MIEFVIHIVKTNMVIHTTKTDMVIHTAKIEMMKLVVETECVGMNVDEFDKETGSSDGLQLEQVDLNYVHALNEPHLHEIQVVPSKHEVDQHSLCANPLLDTGCSKHITRDRSLLTNSINKFLGTIKFGNDHMEKIMGYGDYKFGNVTISRVYFVEGLGHNLFSVGQFCDSDLEVAFRQHTCFIHNLECVDLLTRYRGNNLYTLSLGDMMAQGLVRGLPKLKFKKDHLCSACAMGKSKKKSHKPKSKDTNQEKLYLLQLDLCRLMRVKSVNGKKLTSLMKHQLLALYSKTVSLKDDLLFQSMFDELLTPPLSVGPPAPEVIALIDEVIAPTLAESTSSPSSTTVVQDAPSPIAHMGNDPFFGMPIPEVASDQSSSTDSTHAIVHPDHQIS
nr:retrovirus-related Pol polyprotein from transposon TNT 1-94 [Tanacetum cinerariifolium]